MQWFFHWDLLFTCFIFSISTALFFSSWINYSLLGSFFIYSPIKEWIEDRWLINSCIHLIIHSPTYQFFSYLEIHSSSSLLFIRQFIILLLQLLILSFIHYSMHLRIHSNISFSILLFIHVLIHYFWHSTTLFTHFFALNQSIIINWPIHSSRYVFKCSFTGFFCLLRHLIIFFIHSFCIR